MAHPSVIINSVTYPSVPSVNIPKSGGGTATFYDASETNLTAEALLTGFSGIGANGEVDGSIPVNGSVSGTISTKAGTVTIPSGHTTGGTVGLASSAVSDCIASNILKGKTILGVQGSLAMVSVQQDSSTHVLSIS